MPSDGDFKYTLMQLIDLASLRQLMACFGRLADIQLSMLDPEGRLLVSANWQSVCSHFHRANPLAYQRCVESDLTTVRHHQRHGVGDGKTPVEYICQNGMGCVSLPVIIEDNHLGDLFFSQFFTAPPDEKRFRQQAREFGFEEELYLEAVRQVKVRSRDEVRQMLDFMHQLVQLVADQGARTLKDLQARELGSQERDRLQRQNEALLEFNRQRQHYLVDLERAIPEILRQVGVTLEVSRTSVWLFSKDRKRLTCRHSGGGTGDLRGMALDCAAYPAYVAAIEGEREIIAPNAREDLRTRGMSADFLQPNGTQALLDTALWRGSRVIGVLSCAQTGQPRHWRSDEIRFAHSVADLLSQLLETDRRRRVELALKESERRLTTMMDHLPGVVYRCIGPPEWDLTFVSKGVEEITGYPADDFLQRKDGLSLERLTLPEDRSRITEEIDAALETGRSFEVEYRITDRQGRERWLWEQGQAVRTMDRGELVMEGYIADITEQKRIEQFKEEMLSVVSHEMRTPLASMLGFTELLLEHDLPPDKTRDILETLHKETDRLREMMENLLDLQQLRSGRLQYAMQKIRLDGLSEELVTLFQPLTESQRLQREWADDLPPVWGDQVRLFQLLRNLVSNAVKYSPEGSTVTLGAQRRSGEVLIWVRDQGLGIPPEQRERIFERFYRVDTVEHRRAAGVGLGLALVKEIADAHQGRVWAEAAPDRGTIIYLALPVFTSMATD